MKTPQLYDLGEDTWQEKLHVGCGGIYLNGYTNIDVRGEMSKDLGRRELKAHASEIGEYYKRDGGWNSLPNRGRIVVDKKVNMQDLSYEYKLGSVDKIVAIQSMEHLDPMDFISTLNDFYDVLRKPGVLIVSVPDTIGSLDWMVDSEKVAFATRHLRGSMKDDWSQHQSWWTHATLAKAFEWVGFDAVRPLANFHCYPSVVMHGQKL